MRYVCGRLKKITTIKKKKKENVFYSPKQEQPVTNKHFNKRGDVAYCKGV
jgi:hypothetical protein